MDSSFGSLPIISVDDGAGPNTGGKTGCGSAESATVQLQPSRRLPPWLRRNLEPGGGHGETAHLIAELGLETVCS